MALQCGGELHGSDTTLGLTGMRREHGKKHGCQWVTHAKLTEIAMLVLPAVTEELKTSWQYRPKCLSLPCGSGLKLNVAFLLEKSGSEVNML